MAAVWQQSAHVAVMSAPTDLPIQATHPPRHCPVSLGRLQRAQAAGPHQDHLVIAAATGLLHPGYPRPPGTIAFMPLRGEQMPGHATRQLDQRLSMRSYVRLMCFDPVSALTFSPCHIAVTPACIRRWTHLQDLRLHRPGAVPVAP